MCLGVQRDSSSRKSPSFVGMWGLCRNPTAEPLCDLGKFPQHLQGLAAMLTKSFHLRRVN